jgi:hypothetical protein
MDLSVCFSSPLMSQRHVYCHKDSAQNCRGDSVWQGSVEEKKETVHDRIVTGIRWRKGETVVLEVLKSWTNTQKGETVVLGVVLKSSNPTQNLWDSRLKPLNPLIVVFRSCSSFCVAFKSAHKCWRGLQKHAYKTSAVIVQLNKNATWQLWLPRQVADKDATAAILVATVVML